MRDKVKSNSFYTILDLDTCLKKMLKVKQRHEETMV